MGGQVSKILAMVGEDIRVKHILDELLQARTRPVAGQRVSPGARGLLLAPWYSLQRLGPRGLLTDEAEHFLVVCALGP